MRHGWDYKKLGDVCTIERGGSPRPITDYITDSPDGVNWIKIGDAKEGSKYITSTKEKIKKEGVKKSRYVHKGDFILSNSMSFGRPYILDVDGCIHDGWLVIHDDNNVFIKDYLYYLLASPVMYAKFKQLAVGGVVNNLNSALVRKVEIPIPNMTTQEVIVKELDKINKLISLKKQQLADYDNLAQSIFYEMFGDPVVNEKGWEVKKLGEVCECITDGDHMPPPKSDTGIPFVTIGNVNKASRQIDFDNTYFVPRDYFDNIPNIKKPRRGDVLYTVTGSYGIPIIINYDKEFCFQRHIGLLRPKDFMSPVFLCMWALNDRTKGQADMVATGIAQKTVSLKSLRNFAIILPPLPLQQLFAQRIELIEQQKAEIQSTIADLETLLASRMQYWFD